MHVHGCVILSKLKRHVHVLYKCQKTSVSLWLNGLSQAHVGPNVIEVAPNRPVWKALFQLELCCSLCFCSHGSHEVLLCFLVSVLNFCPERVSFSICLTFIYFIYCSYSTQMMCNEADFQSYTVFMDIYINCFSQPVHKFKHLLKNPQLVCPHVFWGFLILFCHFWLNLLLDFNFFFLITSNNLHFCSFIYIFFLTLSPENFLFSWNLNHSFCS